MPWDEMILVGRIVRPHGRRGEVVVVTETDFAETRFAPGARLSMERAGAIVEVRVAASRFLDGRAVILLEGVGSIDEAEALRGAELRIPAGELHELPADAYYAHDLAGCMVSAPAGVVGRVEKVDFASGRPLLVVGTPQGEVLIPFVAGICQRVDLAAREIVIEPPPGLLEANVTKKGRA